MKTGETQGFHYPPSRLEILDGPGAKQQAESAPEKERADDGKAARETDGGARGGKRKTGGGGGESSSSGGGGSGSSSKAVAEKKKQQPPRSMAPPPDAVVRGVLGLEAQVQVVATRLELEVGVVEGVLCVNV